MAYSVATTTRNAMLDALSAAVGTNAYIRIYSGTKPTNVGTALTGQTLLAELRGNATNFAPASSGGVMTVAAITADTSADNTGTASWCRVLKSDGTTAIFDCTVGTAGTDIVFNTTAFVSGANVSITSWSITEGDP